MPERLPKFGVTVPEIEIDGDLFVPFDPMISSSAARRTC